MGQAITDYVKFLADARDAVYRLGSDQNAARQLEEDERKKERELEALRKAAAEEVNQTLKKRRDEINSSYDKEIAKGQERLKKAAQKREKAKNQGMKERIFEETGELREYNRDLKVQMRTLFQKDGTPFWCASTFYYSLYYPRGLKEIFIFLVTILLCFLAVPCGIYFLIPKRLIWHLIAVYFVDVVIFGGLYVAVGNRTRQQHYDTIKKGREIRDLLRANRKKIRVITRTIQKDGNEDIYDLEKYDDEIARIQQELSETASRKKDAIGTFENVTKSIISDEIMAGYREQVIGLEEEAAALGEALGRLETSIKEQNIYITDTYGPYLGREFLQPERLAALSKIIQDGSASNITEAIQIYRGMEKAES